MVKKNSLNDYLDLGAQNKGSRFYPPDPGDPNVYVEKRALAAGFFIMWAPSGGGKSTNSLALAMVIGSPENELNYAYVLEPRATGEYNEALQNSSLAMETTLKMFDVYAGSRIRYLIVDSMTYLIPAIGFTCLGGQEDVTMKEGLRRSEILGVLALDAAARSRHLTVIATINSDLFPRPIALEGACEGVFNIKAPGHLIIKDRSHRENADLLIDLTAVRAARQLLGQRAGDDSNSDSDRWI
jgi:hypothetical protein